MTIFTAGNDTSHSVVGDFSRGPRRHEDVAVAQIPVEYPVCMEECQAEGNLVDESELVVVGEGPGELVEERGEVLLAEFHEEDGQAGVGIDGCAEILDQVWVTQATQASDLLVETSHQPLHHPRSPHPSSSSTHPLSPSPLPFLGVRVFEEVGSHLLAGAGELIAVGVVCGAKLPHPQRLGPV